MKLSKALLTVGLIFIMCKSVSFAQHAQQELSSDEVALKTFIVSLFPEMEARLSEVEGLFLIQSFKLTVEESTSSDNILVIEDQNSDHMVRILEQQKLLCGLVEGTVSDLVLSPIGETKNIKKQSGLLLGVLDQSVNSVFISHNLRVHDYDKLKMKRQRSYVGAMFGDFYLHYLSTVDISEVMSTPILDEFMSYLSEGGYGIDALVLLEIRATERVFPLNTDCSLF